MMMVALGEGGKRNGKVWIWGDGSSSGVVSSEGA